MKPSLLAIALVISTPVYAESKRHMDAHEHGVGTLNIAIEDSTIAMEFKAPGADIVGFEYAAKSDEDLAAVDAARAILSQPLDLFQMPEDAGCSVVKMHVELESRAGHEEHGEEHHDEHEAHDDDEHAGEAGHTEFHAEYTLNCKNPDEMTAIEFTYFDKFENAREIELQIVSASGALAFEVERDAPLQQLEN